MNSLILLHYDNIAHKLRAKIKLVYIDINYLTRHTHY